MCTYAGPASGALPGPCTGTAGYISNAEINFILATNPSARQYYDSYSDSNIVIYNGDQYIAFMNDTTKYYRTVLYQGINFGGISDWAVDLQQYLPPVSTQTSSGQLTVVTGTVREYLLT